MPFVIQSSVAKNVILGVWRIDETVPQLIELLDPGPDEVTYLETLKSELRKKQWLSYRVAINHLILPAIGGVIYDEYGKPKFKNHPWHLSVSHSGIYAAAIVGKENPVGIDVEKLKPRVERIADKFLSEEELSSISTENRVEKLYVYWGAKESLYKLHGQPEIDFRKNIFIKPFNYLCNGIGKCMAILRMEEVSKEYCISYIKIDGYILVYAMEI